MSVNTEQFDPNNIKLSDNTNTWINSLANAHPNLATNLLRRACWFAENQSAKQLATGLAIAEELLSLSQDSTTIATAIAYPALKAATISNTKQEQILTKHVCRLIDGVKKMDAFQSMENTIIKGSQYQNQIDKLRKMLLAMVDDIRIVLIKLAERVIALREVKNESDDIRKTTAKEVMTIYAPLANRLGIGHLKWQLEDLAFRYLELDTYTEISKALNMQRTERENFIHRVMNRLKTLLDNVYIKNADISGRAKHIFSIYRKLQRKQVDISEIYDASAVRILLDNLEDCYTVLGLVHAAWKHIPKEFDDYIAHPKPNGYRSIHTAVIGPDEHNIEIQIRTKQMHAEAELGVAAHWIYKEGKSQESGYERKISWLRQVMDWQQEISDTGDQDSQLFHDTFDDQVYVFTPNGDIIDLPTGATALDFAYKIHTDVGHRCRGARINKKLEPLTTALKTGDKIEIITTKTGHPSRDWLRPQLGYLKTHHAIQKVKYYFRRQAFKSKLEAGNTIWEKARRQHTISRHDLETIAKEFHLKSADSLLAAIGDGEISIHTVIHKLSSDEVTRNTETSPLKLTLAKTTKSATGFIIEGERNLLTTIAQCCKPIPGDNILGFITRGRGVTIHKQQCNNLKYMLEKTPERIIHVNWGESRGQYPVDIILHAKSIAENELVRDVVSSIANSGYKISSMLTNYSKSRDQLTLTLTTIIDDQENLAKLLTQLMQLPNVISAKRAS